MTNEEAIEYIHDMRCDIRNNSNYSITDKENTALNVALEALKAEPCEDYVSRNAAFKAIVDTYTYCKDCSLAIAGEPCASKCEEYHTALATIAALPSVTPKPLTGHWIDDCPIMTDEGLVRVIRCSCCNEQRKDYYGVSKDYCPKCGAKMEGE